MVALYLIALALSAFTVTAVGVGVCWLVLRQQHVMDLPSARGNHDHPVPRGGGVAILLAIGGFGLVSGAPAALVWGMLFLGIISLMDDVHSVPPGLRLAVQFAVVMLALPLLPALVPGWPYWADGALKAVIWLGFVNLTNFMDGIDGLAGGEGLMLGLGLALVATCLPHVPVGLVADGLVVAGACLGFLLWNWHPARIFMGDVGSTALGYALGFLLLQLAGMGQAPAALLLPGYFLVDGGVTLLGRILRGEKFWLPHSRHGYQRAVRAGMAHNAVVRLILWLNGGLLLLALLAVKIPAMGWPLAGLGLGAAFLLRGWFCHRGGKGGAGGALAA